MRGCVSGRLPSTGASDCGKPASIVGSKNIKLILPLELHRGKEAHSVVFNSLGQKVMELVNSQKSAGYHTEIFDATRLSSGVYFYKLTTPSFTDTKRMLLIK